MRGRGRVGMRVWRRLCCEWKEEGAVGRAWERVGWEHIQYCNIGPNILVMSILMGS